MPHINMRRIDAKDPGYNLWKRTKREVGCRILENGIFDKNEVYGFSKMGFSTILRATL